MTRINVQSPGASSPRRSWTARASHLWLALLAVVFLTSCSGVSEIEPESFASLDAGFAGIAEVDGEIWLAVNNFLPTGGAELRMLDDDGSTVSTVEVTEHWLFRDLLVSDGLLWAREGGPVDFSLESTRLEGHSLLGINPLTGEVIHEYGVPPLTGMDEGLFFIIDGEYWQPSVDMLTHIDLETGESTYSNLAFGGLKVFVEEEFLWVVGIDEVDKVSLETHVPVATYQVDEGDEFANGWVKRYEGKFWIAEEFNDAENAYEYELETGEYSNPVPRDSFPARWFESGDSRWELFNQEWVGVPQDPQPTDTWRRVDLETGEVIGEYDFGDYRPEMATDDYLWLTRYTETGFELARMPLS